MWRELDFWLWRKYRTNLEIASLFALGVGSTFSGLGFGLLSGFGFLSGLLIGAGTVLAITALLIDCGFKTACGIEDL